MIFLTPTVGRLLHHEVLIDAVELSLQRRAVEIAIANASHEVLDHLVRECSTTTEETHYGRRTTTVSVKVVVLAPDKFRKTVQHAYESGRKDCPTPESFGDVIARAEKAELELKNARAYWDLTHTVSTARAEKAEAELMDAARLVRSWSRTFGNGIVEIAGTSTFLNAHGGM